MSTSPALTGQVVVVIGGSSGIGRQTACLARDEGADIILTGRDADRGHAVVAEVLEGYETLKRLATTPSHIVPGHDPLVLQRYAAAKPGLEGWVARLDVAPSAA